MRKNGVQLAFHFFCILNAQTHLLTFYILQHSIPKINPVTKKRDKTDSEGNDEEDDEGDYQGDYADYADYSDDYSSEGDGGGGGGGANGGSSSGGSKLFANGNVALKALLSGSLSFPAEPKVVTVASDGKIKVMTVAQAAEVLNQSPLAGRSWAMV